MNLKAISSINILFTIFVFCVYLNHKMVNLNVPDFSINDVCISY